MFFKQLLLLGGIYFLLSFISDFIPKFPEGILFCLLSGAIIILSIKKSFVFLVRFSKSYPKITNYLQAIGLTQYIAFLFLSIPAIIEGYYAAKAQYNNQEYISLFTPYLHWAVIMYFMTLIGSLVWATYRSFINKTTFEKQTSR